MSGGAARRALAGCALAAAILGAGPRDLGAYTWSLPSWPSPNATVYYGLLGEPYRSAFVSAANEWTSATNFDLTPLSSAIGACSGYGGDLMGGVVFAAYDCDGDLLGASTLGVTLYQYDSARRLAAGIVFNSAVPWSVYDGAPRYQPDFRRVALHELGHFAGLGHETSLLAIMQPFVDATYHLQPDDIAGMNALFPVLAAPALVAPTGAITSARPSFQWTAVADATWYLLDLRGPSGQIASTWYRAGDAGCASGAGVCSVAPGIRLANGAHVFQVEAWNARATGVWSAAGSFTVNANQATPGAASLVDPTGTIATARPIYRWNAVAGASWYQLYVSSVAGGLVAAQWLQAADAGCAGAGGVCAYDLGIRLANGAHQFWVQTWNDVGNGPWSARGDFVVDLPVLTPGAATIVAPAGTIASSRPTYAWNAVANATWYQVFVGGDASAPAPRWLRALEAGCASGVGTCSADLGVSLANRAYRFWVQTWNDWGAGPWSAASDFVVNAPVPTPAAATLVAPLGPGASAQPLYTWNAVGNSTWYQVYLAGGAGQVVTTRWLRAAEAGCGAGTGVCSADLGRVLASGAYTFWIQTWNADGSGPWSAAGDFSVP